MRPAQPVQSVQNAVSYTHLDVYKRQRQRVADVSEINDLPSNENVENSVADSDMAFRIHLVLHRLEEPYKEIFQLRVFGELSFSQIAAIFGKTESWARVTYHRRCV